MTITLIIKLLILIMLIYISFRDIKERIIPDWTVLLIIVLSSLYFFINNSNIKDYLFYIFVASVPMLIISFIVETISKLNKYKFDYLIIIISAIVGLVIPFDYKIKFITTCFLVLTFMLVQLFIKHEKENDDEALSIGGGDIKLIAVLGPILQLNILDILFISFLLALINMKIKKINYIYLAPFICVGYLILLILEVISVIK